MLSVICRNSHVDRGHGGVNVEGTCCSADVWNNGQYARGNDDLRLDITEEGEDEEDDDEEEDEEGTSVSGFSQGHRASTDGRPESQLTSVESQSPCPGFDARAQQLDERTASIPPRFSTLLPNSIMSLRNQMTSPSAILDYMSRRRTPPPPPPLSQPVIGGRSASHLMAVIMAEDSWRMSLLAANKRI